jgi:hypothetical protein
MLDEQYYADKFYFENGECCAGCDYWERHNSIVGECKKSAPVSEKERLGYLRMEGMSINIGAGHVLTKRGDKCGDFKDVFDWENLPPTYLRKIKYKTKG